MRKIITLTRLSTTTPDIERLHNRNVENKTYTGVMCVLGPRASDTVLHFIRDDAAYQHTSTIKNIEYVASDKIHIDYIKFCL